MPRKTRVQRAVAIIATLSVMTPQMSVVALAVPAAAPQAKPPAAAAPATASAQPGAKPPAATPAPPPIDGGWPRVYNLASGGSVLVYQPQVASWIDQKHMV